MAVISKIRKRSGLIVTFIGVALFAFIVGDFQGQLFGSKQQNAGEISGKPVSFIAYDNEVQRLADIQKERRRQAALDEETMNSIRDRVWETYIQELALKPQFQKAGLSISDAEVKELILGNDPDPLVSQYFTDRSTNQIYPYFRDPVTGKLNTRMVKVYVDSLPPQEKSSWNDFEDMLRDSRTQAKYLGLVKKGLYVTTLQAKQDYEDLNRSVNFDFILQPYSSMPDSLVKFDKQDLLKYYNENRYKYKQDASRKLEYVSFDLKPTREDFNEVKAQMISLKNVWSTIKSKHEDSLFVIRESDSRHFDTTYYSVGQLPFQIDSLAHHLPKETILPMFMENNMYRLGKVFDSRMIPDSVKARHILIQVPQRDTLAKMIAKEKIDSLEKVILNQHNFAEMAKEFSQDGGSRDSAGSLGWFTQGSMVPEFDRACFEGKKGDLKIVYTNYGYHLIEILDQTKPRLKTQVAFIDRLVEPGSKTRQDVYNRATDFVSKYHAAGTFEKGVEENNLVPHIVEQLKESDRTIAGIENPIELIRWAFNASAGDVSAEPISFSDKYVIAYLAEIHEEGYATLEQKKQEVEIGAIKAKKAEKFLDNMNKLNAKTLTDYSSKMNLEIKPAIAATFNSYALPNVGRELNLYGSVFTLKNGETSKPITGEAGVYVLRIDGITEPVATTNYSVARKQAESNYSYRVDVETLDAIKKKANIQDNRAKFF